MNTNSLSNYHHVFCDSKKALKLAYEKGLPKDALIYTSSPALLCNSKDNQFIQHIESRWKLGNMCEFQGSIQEFSEEVFQQVSLLNWVSHEEALCITRTATMFNKLIFKAACLVQPDYYEDRLILQVGGNFGPIGNVLNPPWPEILQGNANIKVLTIKIEDGVNHKRIKNNRIPLRERLYIGGVKTVIYRLVTKLEKVVPSFLFKKTVLIASENELIIETASELFLKGALIKKIKPSQDVVYLKLSQSKIEEINEQLRPIIRKRLKKWVHLCFIDKCEELFFNEVQIHFNDFLKQEKQWMLAIPKNQSYNVLLVNSPVSISGLAVTSACRKSGIPSISAEHGVTYEICKTHGEYHVIHEVNSSDLFLSYNYSSEIVAKKSFFARGEVFVCGISDRHLRLKALKKIVTDFPIVYISTNLYKGNIGLFSSWLTDFDRAKNESFIVNNILAKLPHKVCYKTYPEDNTRYVDLDPVIGDVLKADNIELFDEKVDMRFLVNKYRVFITSKATSTLAWPIMSGKPVVFINRKDNMPLTDEAYKDFSEGIFVFDGDQDEFAQKILDFLSKSIEEIEELWEKKKKKRSAMIKQYFSSYASNSGKRAADFIDKKFLRK